jgi:hypothetical protein
MQRVQVHLSENSVNVLPYGRLQFELSTDPVPSRFFLLLEQSPHLTGVLVNSLSQEALRFYRCAFVHPKL